ncbi:Multifunctional methyltransferase subunit TRM112-like protein [Thelohanellus kitauei]|uniref:Multifunctional methyltransferase subunit TRM112-like protein n=1 Tax=Thelohanellus kitauei TaxID=669202 RepID=A0A0C2J9M8_THEKT|nr:Multifunctional methyltransferase subunit TRM112-like protein [Thelohanellus kitauei]
MRLILHNFLKSNDPAALGNYPLGLEVNQIQELLVDFDIDFLRNIFPKIDYQVLYQASIIIKYDGLPSKIPDDPFNDLQFLKNLHHALLEIDIVEGHLFCYETGRKYKIAGSVPNML